MNEFNYTNGFLFAEKISLQKIAEEVGTPFYCYSKNAIVKNFLNFKKAFKNFPTMVCFAVKANSNLSVLRILSKLGAGADVVSMGELMKALSAGIDPKKIIFSGVGKSREEISKALGIGIKQFNVESESEFMEITNLAKKAHRVASVSLRINPNVIAKTHRKITTGSHDDKFGITCEQAIRLFQKSSEMQEVNIIGLAIHIGSQITKVAPFKEAFDVIRKLANDLKRMNFQLQNVDVGGGLGIQYANENTVSLKNYSRIVSSLINSLQCGLILEPGRFIVADAGVLVTKILRLKSNGRKHFIIVDSAMNDFIRPAIYDAYHKIIPLKKTKIQNLKSAKKWDIVGPICESSDTFARNRIFRDPKENDILAICSTGAYGFVMSSNYNSRQHIPEILISGKKYALIRKRQKMEHLIKTDILPRWL